MRSERSNSKRKPNLREVGQYLFKGEGFGERGYPDRPGVKGGGGFPSFLHFLTGVHLLTC